MKKLIILLSVVVGLVIMPTQAIADDVESVHFAAHFGASYAINTFTYGFARKVFRLEKPEALVFAAVVTLTGGFLYKYMEGIQDGKMPANTGRALLQDAAGVAASAGTTLMFEF